MSILTFSPKSMLKAHCLTVVAALTAPALLLLGTAANAHPHGTHPHAKSPHVVGTPVAPLPQGRLERTQDGARTIAPDRCLAMSQNGVPRVHRAALETGEVRVTFVGHSTFEIETPKGVRIATDYNDYVRPASPPDIATMNRAHSTHFTHYPEPSIRHVLRGWSETPGAAALHDVSLDDVRVRNVPTNIRLWEGGGTDVFGNSIFVFEVAGLCIAHLGHLHHTLSLQQLANIGQMDVVLVPVDGSYTLDLPGMIEVLKALKAPLMIPMHYFSRFTLSRFLGAVGDTFDVAESDNPTIVVSRTKLPAKQQVLVLPGR